MSESRPAPQSGDDQWWSELPCSREVFMDWLVTSCREQGVPLVLRDADTIRTVAALMNPPPPKRRRRKPRPPSARGKDPGGAGPGGASADDGEG